MIASLELDGIVYATDFLLCDADVCFCDLNTGVVENLIQKNETFSTMPTFIVNISAKGFTESMSGKMVNFNLILILKPF